MLKRLVSIYANYKKGVAMLLGLIFVSQCMSLVSPFIFGKMMDSVIKKQSMWTSVILASTTLIFFWVGALLRNSRTRINFNHVWFPIQEHLRMKTIDRYLAFSIGQHRNSHSGVNQEITVNGEASMLRLATAIVTDIAPMLMRFVVTVGMLLWLHLPLGLIILLGLCVYVVLQYSMEKKYTPLIDKNRDMAINSSRHRGEVFRGAVLIKTHAKEAFMRDEHRVKYKRSVDSYKESTFFITKWDSLIGFSMALSQYGALIYGILMIYKGNLTVGGLITAQVWWNQACIMIESLGDRYQDFLREVSQVKKFFDLIDLPIAIKESENPVHLKEVRGYIQFKNVSFAYPKPDGMGVGKEVLTNISLRINEGEKIAIVGPTGSGKTTLMTLLFRGYDPDKGTVEVDGYDVRDLSLSSYYKYIAVVDQSSLMIDGTIKENIQLGVQHENFTEENMHQLCRMAELNAENFQEGLDKHVGQDGKNLSGGERQRLAIVRALAGNPKILVLDEATASLDGITEAKVQKAIDLASSGRTTIIIAHRLATVQNADRIYLMDEGRIVAVGTHRELLKSSPLYAELVEKQKITV